ncbi:uncharacterized protein LOC114246342 [Bombyx mandarina]|uniref:Uncharacterized protein n=2 Tax=Bombyx TaxID=7090 RepID=A0A8R2AI70_BOMMO|nr:uncharacterized protein LOC101739600 [Bombyx mori]XP_028034617.1 uncharacterized protein LOC114246342 [Bombyx mandarina]
MVRWRYCFVLAVLLLLPMRTGSKMDEDDDDEQNEDGGEGEEDNGDEEEDEPPEKIEAPGRRAPPVLAAPKTIAPLTRTTSRRLLECYVCAYKTDTPIRSCLDPAKHRVHVITCHSTEDKCFTSVTSRGSDNNYEAVIRGCKSGCVGSPDTTCCELNRCNNQAFAMPIISKQILTANKTEKIMPPTILFFVTVLLLLQTVVKVSFA